MKKRSDTTRIQVELEFLRESVANIALELFEGTRMANRLAMVLLSMDTQGREGSAERYRLILIMEKMGLVRIIEKQIEYLMTLKTPKVILQDKKRQLMLARNALRQTKSLDHRAFARLARKECLDRMERINLDLSTCLVDTAVPADALSGGEGSRILERLVGG